MNHAAEDAFRRGQFKDADRLLRDDNSRALNDQALRLQVDYFLGRAEQVRKVGPLVFETTSQDPLLASKCASILASQYSDDGEFTVSLELSRRAIDFAERCGDLVQLSSATCALLERTCDRAAFRGSLPLSLLARRLSIRCGLPQVTSATHLAFGRLEARVGHFQSAMRHFTLSRDVLTSAPNLMLSASVDLD